MGGLPLRLCERRGGSHLLRDHAAVVDVDPAENLDTKLPLMVSKLILDRPDLCLRMSRACEGFSCGGASRWRLGDMPHLTFLGERRGDTTGNTSVLLFDSPAENGGRSQQRMRGCHGFKVSTLRLKYIDATHKLLGSGERQEGYAYA